MFYMVDYKKLGLYLETGEMSIGDKLFDLQELEVFCEAYKLLKIAKRVNEDYFEDLKDTLGGNFTEEELFRVVTKVKEKLDEQEPTYDEAVKREEDVIEDVLTELYHG